jgi:hypothetical protein
LTAKDAKGREFIKEIVERKEGIIYYPWIESKKEVKLQQEKKLLPMLSIQHGNGLLHQVVMLKRWQVK